MGLRKLDKKDSVTLEEVIGKGGEVASDKVKKNKRVNFTLSIPQSMLDDIEHEIMQRRIGISKTAWILEAIQEKFQR